MPDFDENNGIICDSITQHITSLAKGDEKISKLWVIYVSYGMPKERMNCQFMGSLKNSLRSFGSGNRVINPDKITNSIKVGQCFCKPN